MSTNYYVHQRQQLDPIHIGKSAAGWRFMFRSYPDLGLESKDSWLKFIRQPGVEISDEYGSSVSPSELEDVMNREYFGDTPLKVARRGAVLVDGESFFDHEFS